MWRLLNRFADSKRSSDQFVSFIQQAHFESTNKTIKNFFTQPKTEPEASSGCTSHSSTKIGASPTKELKVGSFVTNEEGTVIEIDLRSKAKKLKQSESQYQAPTDADEKKESLLLDKASNTIAEVETVDPTNSKEDRLLKSNEQIVKIVSVIDGEPVRADKSKVNSNDSFLSAIDNLTQRLKENNRELAEHIAVNHVKKLDENLNKSEATLGEIVEEIHVPPEDEFVIKKKKTYKITDYFCIKPN